MIWLLPCLIIVAQQPSIQSLRLNYSTIVNDEKQCAIYLNYFNKIKNPSATENAFYAALLASSAQFNSNPYTKIKIVKQAQDIFTKSIGADSENPEIRYLRLTVEQNTPRILGLSSHINEDKNLLIHKFKTYVSLAGLESAKQVIAFLKYHKLCNDIELAKLEPWIR